MNNRPKKIHIITLGCAKNTVDSEVLQGQLRGNNLQVIPDIGDAEIAIINTCGFIDDAKKQSVDTILGAVRMKSEGRLEKVYVMGCLSQRYHAELSREIPEVDRFFGSNELRSVLHELGAEYKYALLGERALSTPGHYAYLKISEGCDNPCSFCAIPLMRGRHRSKPIDQVMKEVMHLVHSGVRELIVIGQDTTYYGLDLYGERMLGSLLCSLASVGELEWIRLMYTYPAKFPPDVLRVIAEHPKICRYIDMPIQHASDALLKSMRRGITPRRLEDLLGRIRMEIPGIAIRTTLITGYPGEAEKDVEELIGFLKRVRFDRLGVFTYSREEGTSAFALGDPVPQVEKEARRARIMDVQREISLERNEERIETHVRAVVEREEDGVFIGRTEWDAPEIDNEVFISAPEGEMLHPGEFVTVHITDAAEYDLYGEVIRP